MESCFMSCVQCRIFSCISRSSSNCFYYPQCSASYLCKPTTPPPETLYQISIRWNAIMQWNTTNSFASGRSVFGPPLPALICFGSLRFKPNQKLELVRNTATSSLDSEPPDLMHLRISGVMSEAKMEFNNWSFTIFYLEISNLLVS